MVGAHCDVYTCVGRAAAVINHAGCVGPSDGRGTDGRTRGSLNQFEFA